MMTRFFRPVLVLAVLLVTATLACAQIDRTSSQVAASGGATTSERGSLGSGNEREVKSAELKEAARTSAPSHDPAIADPLVRMLIVKGVLTEDEGRTISSTGTPAEQRDRLAALLRDKGLISTAEFEAVRTVAPAAENQSLAAVSPASATDVLKPEASGTTEKQSAPPTVIAAVAPTRLLQVDPPKREGLIPDIKLGSGARLKLYGFFKTSIVHDSSSPQGNDFPLPLLATDTGPTSAPEFHLRARGLRLGANFE